MESIVGSPGRLRPRLRAIVDLGSNTGRVVVLRFGGTGSVEILGDARARLRLIREIDARGHLKPEGIGRTLQVLQDFCAVAEGTGAKRVLAVATAAVREAADGEELLRRIRQGTGMHVRILDGAQEARLAFLGAVYGLPVEHGFLADLGGGSLQIVQFRRRRLLRSWSLPLGALRLSDRFLSGRQPTARDVRRLQTQVAYRFARVGIPSLGRDDTLLGTGGTIRSLAKIDSRLHPHPIPRIHGYSLSQGRVGELAVLLRSHARSSLGAVPGLNRERKDSITGGCLIVETLMDLLGAKTILVSGQGLREGVAFDSLGAELPGIAEVRRFSILDLTSRFTGWSAERARRRLALVDRLYRRLHPEVSEEVHQMLRHAAVVIDIGRSIDYYRRRQHCAMILRCTNLMGFSHRDIALLSAIVEMADGDSPGLDRYRPLLTEADWRPVVRAGIILALADDIEHRLPVGTEASVRCRVADGVVTLRAPALEAWRPRVLGERFRKAFGMVLGNWTA